MMGIRRRKHRPAARPLDASWIESDDAELLQSSSASTMDDRSTLSQKEANANNDTTDSPEVQTLEVPDASQHDSTHSRSPAPSQSSGGFRPSSSVSANDDVSFNSEQGPGAMGPREPTSAKPRKRRYATKHHSHWLEEGGQPNDENAQLPKQQPQAESGRPQPPADFSQLGSVSTQQQDHHQHRGEAAAGVKAPRAPSTKSPSIFHLAPHDTNQGCDAPPITPKVHANYSPFGQ